MTITDDTLIHDLPLSNRVKHALYQGHYGTSFPYHSYKRTFGEVRTLSDQTLLRIPGFGVTSLREWVRVRDEALGLAPSYDPTSRQVVTAFERLVRPLLGDAYDAAFPERAAEADASLNADEQSMIEALCELHARAACVKDEEARANTRHALALALKALRKSAETRAKKERLRSEPLYRFRVTTPDGNVIEYPTRGTKNINQRYVLLYRDVRKPVEHIKANVRADYASRWDRVMPDDHRIKLANEIHRNFEAQVAEQEDVDLTWRMWDSSDRPDLFEKKIRTHVIEPTDRWPHEFMLAEGTPFDVNKGENQ
jgi:hypothetical protein